MKQTTLTQISVVLQLALAVLVSSVAHGGTTVAYGSTVGATNLTSTSLPLDSGFTFQLGTFADGFNPTSDNTDDWLYHWRSLGGVQYSTDPVGGPFPPELLVNSFGGSVLLEDNIPPFDIGGQIYIWGYDQRAVAGPAEWILVSGATWLWPDGSQTLPALGFTVAAASSVVLGSINQGGVEMRTAAVTVSDSGPMHYESWLAEYFSEAILDDPAEEAGQWGELADPDADGISNLLEYFSGGYPTKAAPVLDLFAEDDELVVRYSRASETVGIEGWLEWSSDLEAWQRDGLVEVSVDGGVETRIGFDGGTGRRFFRLVVRRVEE